MIMENDLRETIKTALAWTGIFAVVYTLASGIYEVAVFGLAVLVFGLLFSRFSPSTQKARRQKSASAVLFRITPLQYPKIHDADTNAYAPEFIKLDIIKDGANLFSSDLARDTIKTLRETLDAALSPTAAEATAKKHGKA